MPAGILGNPFTNAQHLTGRFRVSHGPFHHKRAEIGLELFKHVDLGANQMKNLVSRFVKDESGATAIEYGLIATLIGVAIIAGATALGGALNDTFQGVADNPNLG